MPRPKDVHLNSDGDLELGHNGDIACVYDDDVTAENVIFRLKTYAGDNSHRPECGASLEDFIGEVSTPTLGERVRARVWRSLTHDRFIAQDQLAVDVAPLSPTTLAILVTVKGTRGSFAVASSLDLLTGKILVSNVKPL